jgi:choline dehydrogenase-like flavoprotein
MHDVKNVFVVEGAAFTTASEKNPTLTILALAWRASDYLANEMKAKRLYGMAACWCAKRSCWLRGLSECVAVP